MPDASQPLGHVLVIGAGPAGLRAALDLVDLGAKVTIVERGPAPGGVFTQLDVQYPTVDCGACQIHESLAGPPWAARQCLRTGVDHPMITTLTSTAITAATPRDEGGFDIALSRGGRWIDPSKCQSCGTCADLCPVIVSDEHQAGLCSRTVAYRPHLLTDPPVYCIDETLCNRCGDCVPACPEGAIELDRPARETSTAIDAIVVATGFSPFDPSLQPQWSYGRHLDVITALELERMIRPRPEGGLNPPMRRSTGDRADRVAFVQCVGSRDLDHRYCSAICCMHALKEAIVLREQLGVSECHIYAIDMRCTGKGYESTLERAVSAGVRVVYARPGAVEAHDPDAKPVLRVESPSDARGTVQGREPYDLVVLSTGLTPSKGSEELATLLQLDVDEQGFFSVLPGSFVQTSQPGVFVCGAAAGPCDLPWSITTASQAALLAAHHAGTTIARRASTLEPEEATPKPPRAVPLTPITKTGRSVPELDAVRVIPRALVLGAGPAGLAAAKRIADAGLEVIIVEREPAAGGNLKLAKRLIDGRDPARILEELLEELEVHEATQLLLGWELVEHAGGPGDATAVIRNMKTGEVRPVRHGALVVATGGTEIPASGRFGAVEGDPARALVITQRQLEGRLDSGDAVHSVERPTVVMIQCVGSREPERPVCSRVCCHEALKNALWITERSPGARVFILHRDLRAVGFDELWYEQARTKGIVAIRVPEDRAPVVEAVEGGGEARAVVRFHDSLIGRDVRVDADLVVLSTGLEPNLSVEEAERLGLSLDRFGFVVEANVKYRPVEADRRGLLVAGAAVAPVLVPEAMAQGEAAAARVIARLSREHVMPRPGAVAYRAKWCAICGLCVDACPAGARELDVELGAIIHAGLCQGCGACAAACPSGCTEQPDLDIKGVLDAIEAAWEVVP